MRAARRRQARVDANCQSHLEENTMLSAGTPVTTAMKDRFIVALIAGLAFIASATIQGQRPKPFACDTDNGGLTLPAGFFAGGISAKLGTPRKLLVAPNGGHFVFVR